VLISTYELGHQPFGVASPAAWLRADGMTVSCLDLAVDRLDEDVVRSADLVAFYLPMHTATRLAVQVIPTVRRLNPAAVVCAYGLYAPVNGDFLRSVGAAEIIGGEFEEPLAELARRVAAGDRPATADAGAEPAPATVSLARQRFLVPDRVGLPLLSRYAALAMPDGRQRITGYTEATRGCKHLCRHCPVVPVYGGKFRVVQDDVVLADVAQQVAAGAEHITFGDPDFFNGPAHAVTVVRALHEQFPGLSYDVTIKIEHLVKHANLIPVLAETGCLLVTTAAEAFDERILEIFDKQHTRADFRTAVDTLSAHGIALNPTFVAFTPWTSAEIYVDFLATLHELRLVENVSPVQYGIRLLIPQGSRLLELPETHEYLRGFDPDALCYRWTHPDPRMDALQQELFRVTADSAGQKDSAGRSKPRAETFAAVCRVTAEHVDEPLRQRLRALGPVPAQDPVPGLTEPWYCCAEPVELDLTSPV